MSKFKPSNRPALHLDKESVSDKIKTGNFKISFAYFDPAPMYASSFHDWQKSGLLSKAMETLQGFCKRPLRQQIDGDKFAIYQSFPPSDKTKFEYPKHVVGDTFYLVFLDKTHKFWLTKKALGK